MTKSLLHEEFRPHLHYLEALSDNLKTVPISSWNGILIDDGLEAGWARYLFRETVSVEEKQCKSLSLLLHFSLLPRRISLQGVPKKPVAAVARYISIDMFLLQLDHCVSSSSRFRFPVRFPQGGRAF